MNLRISDDLRLPIDAATQTFAFIARKGAGKTYAAGKLTELLLEAKVQVIILDTVGNWYGLRLSSDGKAKGFDVPVFGGLRGDLPLQAQSGELVADVAVDTGRSLILDLSQFSLADRKRFATAFGERLWKKKKAETHPTPLMLVIEESQLIIPQKVDSGTATMVGIYEEIVRLGRNYGIGVTMISQRPQSVNKEVLNQTECLFVLQVNGAQERKALKEWITHQGMDPALLDELPSLPIGTAYVWSPQWLGILEKVKIAKKVTFDASATPRVGDRLTRRAPAPLDLGELEKQMAATIAVAKQNDPRELKKEIGELRSEISSLKRAATKTEIREVPVIKEAQIQRLEAAVKEIVQEIRQGVGYRHQLALYKPKFANTEPRPVSTSLAVAKRAGASEGPERDGNKPLMRNRQPRGLSPTGSTASDALSNSELTRPRQRILNVLATFEAMGVSAPVKSQVAVFAEQSPTSSGFMNNLGALRSMGLIDYPQPGHVGLTDAGSDVAVNEETFSTQRELHEAWYRILPRPRADIVRVLVGHGGPIAKADLAELVCQSPTSSGYANNLGALRSLGLIHYPQPGFVGATDVLFPSI